MRLMDKEEFQAWKEAPATQQILALLKRREAAERGLIQDLLFNQLPSQPEQWQAQQPQLAHRAGLCEGLMQVILLDYEQLVEDDE